MPARTLPAIPSGSRSTHRHQSHSYTFSSQSVSHSDYHDERLQGTYVLYDMTIPSSAMALNGPHNPYPARDHRYPTAFIPPPLQVLHSVQPLRPGPHFVSYQTPTPALLHPSNHTGASIPPPTTWHPLPPPPLFRPPILTPPAPIPHKVWLLDCKSCGTFLTNRGMKAVLLLRPNVPLYSTDAMPINCSAFSDSTESLTGYSSSDPPLSAGPRSSGHSPIDGERHRTSARTCECLTQTLHCHGCGSGVGYMIVSPCHRCMSSITATNRSTNGHRFVFYSSQIVANERHYISGESGVRPFVSPLPPLPLPMASPAVRPGLGVNYLPMHRTISHPLENPPGLMMQEYVPEERRSSVSAEVHSPMSPIEFARSGSMSGQPSPHPDQVSSPIGISPRAPPPSHSTSPQIENGEYASPPSESAPSLRPSGASPEQFSDILQGGDVVFWHHLVCSGEIAAVVEDPRARGPTSLDDPRYVGETEEQAPHLKLMKSRHRGIFAGR